MHKVRLFVYVVLHPIQFVPTDVDQWYHMAMVSSASTITTCKSLHFKLEGEEEQA